MDIYVVTTSVNYEIYTKLNSFEDDNGKLSLLPCDGGWAETWHTY